MYKLKVMMVVLLTAGLFSTAVNADINVVTTQGEEADLAKLYSSEDLIQGLIATELPGDMGWHPANTDPLDQLPAFTDGIGVRMTGLTGLLNDFPGAGNPAKRIQYDFAIPVDVVEIDVFSGNDGRDGRVFHTYTVRFSSDNGMNWSEWIYVQSHPSSTINTPITNAFRVSLTQLTDTNGVLAADVTNLQFDFYSVDNTGGQMRDPYDGINPFTNTDDGLTAAFVSPLIWEIDVYSYSGAYDPIPKHNAPNVPTSQSTLSWKNVDGVDICEVYFGRNTGEPNSLSYKSMLTLIETVEDPGEQSSVTIPETLEEGDVCYWVVDCYDGGAPPEDPNLPGKIWKFTVNDNDIPIVDAGEDDGYWLGMGGEPGQVTVILDGSVIDDGLPNPPGMTVVLWTQVSGPATEIDDNDQEQASVTLTETGTYEFNLWASDGEFEENDRVKIYVGEDSCKTSHMMPDTPEFPIYDFNRDCIVDIVDFAQFAAAWLDCTDTLTGCL